MSNLRVGDIVVFKGQGFLFTVLGAALKLFQPDWDRWGWHTGFICQMVDDKPLIAEALAKGVCINTIDNSREYRIYRWLDKEPERYKVICFVNRHKGDRYDVMAYIWTFVQRAFKKWKLPRLTNDRYTCWEFCEFFCTAFGKPWTMVAPMMFPLISDFLEQRPTLIGNHSGVFFRP
jgi:hypothetical protein